MLRYWFTKETVFELNRKIRTTVKHDSDRNAAVPPVLQLLVALRFYATGCFQRVDGDLFGLHNSTVCRIVSRVSRAIVSLKNQYIRFTPTGETAAGFHRRAGFPGVLGVVNCTHIPIQNTGGVNGELFHNCKGYCSNNGQMVCDEKSEITNIVAHWPG